MNLQVKQNMNNQTTLQYKWSNQVTYGRPQEAMVQLRSWMIPAEACPGTFVTLKGVCGKTTSTPESYFLLRLKLLPHLELTLIQKN